MNLFSSLVILTSIIFNLSSGWEFYKSTDSKRYKAKVPGVVQTDLLLNKIIENPFINQNEKSVQWIDKSDWIYENRFFVSDSLLDKDIVEIVFEGLDTYADVFLNETKIIEANNMFRTWREDIKKHLKRGDNILKVYFHSPAKIDVPKFDALNYEYFASNDQSENGGLENKKISVFARKAGYHYGWDWGPRLVTMGLWRPVYIEGHDNAVIRDLYIHQDSVSVNSAYLTAITEIFAKSTLEGIRVKLSTENITIDTIVNIRKGLNKFNLSFKIDSPKLWWSNGIGKQNLYLFRAEIYSHNKLLDFIEQKNGLRSLKLIRTSDKDGETFYFELNGIPVFCKGANYIPQHSFLPSVTKADYRRLITDAAKANMNMLRVWGGGVYEDDYFYDLCDSLGIMVWQDFMFACSMYPADSEFLENVEKEAVENIIRLRHHPSIALWCGNNECYDAWLGWGWKKQMLAKDTSIANKMETEYYELFHKLLPKCVSNYAPNTPYWPSSPYSVYGERSKQNIGDRHYWEVWHGKKPVKQYNIERSRFFSEYGMQSFPEMKTIKEFVTDSTQFSIDSPVIMSHQRGGTFANSLIDRYITDDYGASKNFQSFLYLNQLMQADAIQTAIEAHRRDMPYCMGTLYWQLNDCWPGASWSSIDFFGRWKALHYAVKRSFADLLISFKETTDSTYIYIVSDRTNTSKNSGSFLTSTSKNSDSNLTSTSQNSDSNLTTTSKNSNSFLTNTSEGVLSIQIISLSGKILFEKQLKILVEENSSRPYFKIDKTTITKFAPLTDLIITSSFTQNNGNVVENRYFYTSTKLLNLTKPKIAMVVNKIEGGYELTLNSDVFARAVRLSLGVESVSFDDNYFDLMPQKSKTVKIFTNSKIDHLIKKIKVESFYDFKHL